MKQYIYILSNPSMPGLIKVGKTTTHPDQRMSELHSTGVPTPFVFEFSAEVEDCSVSERKAHAELVDYRVSKNREFSIIRPTPYQRNSNTLSTSTRMKELVEESAQSIHVKHSPAAH